MNFLMAGLARALYPPTTMKNMLAGITRHTGVARAIYQLESSRVLTRFTSSSKLDYFNATLWRILLIFLVLVNSEWWRRYWTLLSCFSETWGTFQSKFINAWKQGETWQFKIRLLSEQLSAASQNKAPIVKEGSNYNISKNCLGACAHFF